MPRAIGAVLVFGALACGCEPLIFDHAPGQCVRADDGTPCDDGNVCTTETVCRAGVCGGSNPVDTCTIADSDQDFGDIELFIDFKIVPAGDSGSYLRGTPQVQIWDYTEEAKFNIGANKGSGGLWNNSAGAPGKDPLVLADKAFGEWNKFRVLMVGSRVSVWLNEKLVVDHANMENYYDRKTSIPARGPIQLQTHGGEIRWRNIRLREIDSG